MFPIKLVPPLLCSSLKKPPTDLREFDLGKKVAYPILFSQSQQPQSLAPGRWAEPAPSEPLALKTAESTVAILTLPTESVSAEESSAATAASQSSPAAEASSLIGTFRRKACLVLVQGVPGFGFSVFHGLLSYFS